MEGGQQPATALLPPQAKWHTRQPAGQEGAEGSREADDGGCMGAPEGPGEHSEAAACGFVRLDAVEGVTAAIEFHHLRGAPGH